MIRCFYNKEQVPISLKNNCQTNRTIISGYHCLFILRVTVSGKPLRGVLVPRVAGCELLIGRDSVICASVRDVSCNGNKRRHVELQQKLKNFFRHQIFCRPLSRCELQNAIHVTILILHNLALWWRIKCPQSASPPKNQSELFGVTCLRICSSVK